MKPELSIRHKTRAEQETESEASRLIEQIHNALATVATHPVDEASSLDAAADRIERAARDLSFALRELARERSLGGD